MSRQRSFLAWQMLRAAQAQDAVDNLRKKRKEARNSFDPVRDLEEGEFRYRYRLSKTAFVFLCRELQLLTNLRGTQQVSIQQKILVSLFFYATGCYQRPVGVATNLCQKMCSVYIKEVTEALTHPAIINRHIVFPQTPMARKVISQKFFSKYGIPGVVGCVDGSHFKIFTPSLSEEHLYYCRKHYHSINVQMVCDSDYRILNVNAKYGGSNHDSFIWGNSLINNYMQHVHEQGEVCWLLGDSGYPQRPWLMTPFSDVNPGSPQDIFNKKHGTARVLIENTFGRLKNRWRCLSKDRVLHYTPKKSSQIILACCVLYNIALDFKVPEELFDEFGHEESEITREMNNDTLLTSKNTTNNNLIKGRAYRDQLVLKIQ